MSPLDRAAKAAAEYYGEDWDRLPEENPVANGELDRLHFREMVAAAMGALREPSDAMIEAGTDEYPDSDRGLRSDRAASATMIWQAMVDAALAEAA